MIISVIIENGITTKNALIKTSLVILAPVESLIDKMFSAVSKINPAITNSNIRHFVFIFIIILYSFYFIAAIMRSAAKMYAAVR